VQIQAGHTAHPQYRSACAAALVRAGSKQKMVLNSSDKLFAELRDMDFPTAAARVNRDLKRLKDGYDRSKASGQPSSGMPTAISCTFTKLYFRRVSAAVTPTRRGHVHIRAAHTKQCQVCLCVQDKSASVSQIKDFTGELKAHYAHLERHALVVELITKRSPGLGIQSRMRAEQLLLDSFGLDTVCETIEVPLNDINCRLLEETSSGTSSASPGGSGVDLLVCV
jgi:hypothetical protein